MGPLIPIDEYIAELEERERRQAEPDPEILFVEPRVPSRHSGKRERPDEDDQQG